MFGSLPPPVEIRSGGESLHARLLGAGPRLLLLHGGPGFDHHVLLPLAVPLAERLEVLLPDLPGHGRSHVEGTAFPDLSQLVARTASWVEHLDPPVAVMGGHSLGALVAHEVMRRGRIAPLAAVLLSPPVVADPPSGTQRVAPVVQRGATPRSSATALREELLAFCTGDTLGDPSAQMVAAVHMARLRPAVAYRPLIGQLTRSRVTTMTYCRTTCPVLLLRGERDRISSAPSAESLGAAGPPSRMRVLADLGHVPYATTAEPVVEEILRFLTDCRVIPPSGVRG